MRRAGTILTGIGGLTAIGSVVRYSIYLATRPARDAMATEGETQSWVQFQQVLVCLVIGVALVALGAYFLSRSKSSAPDGARL
jgi:hypothetical protein